jgi:hypothetical protein
MKASIEYLEKNRVTIDPLGIRIRQEVSDATGSQDNITAMETDLNDGELRLAELFLHLLPLPVGLTLLLLQVLRLALHPAHKEARHPELLLRLTCEINQSINHQSAKHFSFN